VPQKKGQTGCKSYDLGLMDYKHFRDWDSAILFNGEQKKVRDQSLVCQGDHAFWLVGLKKEDVDGPSARIANPPGWDQFGDDKWGGLTRDEIALK
jgi:hypothetical protein